jgi:hypothetical protein
LLFILFFVLNLSFKMPHSYIGLGSSNTHYFLKKIITKFYETLPNSWF